MTRVSDLEDPISPNGEPVITPSSRGDWRRWLDANKQRTEGIWVVYRKKKSTLDGPLYDDLVEEALCFGWIDSKTYRVDDDRIIQWYTPRRQGGLWSALNKKRIERLEKEGLMTQAGRAVIEQAKADGSWSQADEAEALIVPDDLAVALDQEPSVRTSYEQLADSEKKQYLWSVYSAKRPATRAKRIEDIVRKLSQRPRASETRLP